MAIASNPTFKLDEIVIPENRIISKDFDECFRCEKIIAKDRTGLEIESDECLHCGARGFHGVCWVPDGLLAVTDGEHVQTG